MKTLVDLVVVVALFCAGFCVFIYFREYNKPVVRLDPFITDPACSAPAPDLARRFQTDRNSNPYFRAGSIPFFSARYSFGHGFIVSQDGKLYFITAEHVADIALGDCAYISIPGTKSAALMRYSAFAFSKNLRTQDDEIASFQLQSGVLSLASDQIFQNRLSPLTVDRTRPANGSLVAIPNRETGAFTFYVVDDSSSQHLALVTNGQRGLICSGRSGSPVLLVVGDVVTSRVIGVTSSINQDASFEIGLKNYCGYVAYAIRF